MEAPAISVWKIAAGVFLGNLLFGLLAWAVMSFEVQGARQDAMGAAAHAELDRLQAEQRAGSATATH